MKKLYLALGILLGAFLTVSSVTQAAFVPISVPAGGTGSTTAVTGLGGILAGNGTAAIKSVVIGSNLTWDGTTLSASGGGGTFPFTPASWGNSTSTVIGFTQGIITNASTTFSQLTSGLVGNNNGLLYSFASSSLFGYTPVNPTRALTINGTTKQLTSSAGSQDLSADRTWTLSFPNFVLFPGDIQATNASTTNATTTGSLYLSGITASRPLYVDSTGKVGSAGTGTSGNCVNWGANNTFGDAGAACGSGSGGSGTVGTSTSETSGRIPFWTTNSATPALLSGGSANFVWDSTNSRLGVGTSTPYGQLSINPSGITGPSFVIGSSTATNFIVTNGGLVGIGTAAPTEKLTIVDNSTTARVLLQQNNASGFAEFQEKVNTVDFRMGASNSSGYFDVFSNNPLLFDTNNIERIRVDSGGNTGFASTTPWGQLSINPNNIGAEPEFVVGSSTKTDLIVDNVGRVGVGTSSALAQFDLNAPTGATTRNLISASHTTAGVNTVDFTLASSTVSTLLIGTSTPANGSASATSTIYMQKLQWQGGNSAGTTYCVFLNSSGALTTQVGPCL